MQIDNKIPLVTVITPAYNRASFLDETILSVLSQDYSNIEYIILDDGSDDNSLDVIKKYQDHVIWVSHNNMGETRTVNKGFMMAKGEIVVVVNSDDPLLPGAISSAVDVLLLNPDMLVAYTDWNEIGPQSELIKTMFLPEYNLFHMLTNFNVAMGPGTFIRRYAIEKYGGRDDQFIYVGDLEFWFRLAMKGRFAHISKVLATHRVHPGSLTASGKGKLMADELIRLVKKVYRSKDLSPELRKLKSKVFGNVHFEAASYCGKDVRAKLSHLIVAFFLSPYNTGLRFVRRYRPITYLLNQLPKPVYGILQKIWYLVRWNYKEQI